MTESNKSTGPRSGVSRRAFLKGSGAAAAATALHSQAAAAAEEETSPVVSGLTTLSLKVNGQPQTVKVEPRTTLLEVLRVHLDLTGAKPVSMEGASGSSTVWLDGKPVMASTTLALACQGKEVKTIESLGGDTPDAVVEAFIENDALQCGFCTPGFIIAVRDFLDRNPNATEEEIRAGLNGNICRCGTYANVVKAALAVVKGGGNG